MSVLDVLDKPNKKNSARVFFALWPDGATNLPKLALEMFRKHEGMEKGRVKKSSYYILDKGIKLNIHIGNVIHNSFSYDVNEANFDELVVARSSTLPVLLDIGTDWCAPCKVLTPRLDNLALEYGGKFILAKVDADENMRIAGRHRVRGFPTVIAYSRGHETDRFHGAQPDGFLRNLINRLIEHHQSAT